MAENLFSLTGKTVLITGASSGFGRHFADVLSRAGAQVGLAARRVDALEAAAKDIEANGGTAAITKMDVTDAASV